MPRVVAWSEATGPPPRPRGLKRGRATPSLASTRSWRSGSSDRPPIIRPKEKLESLPALYRRLDEIWQGLQVSRRGTYSTSRMQLLHRYEAKTSLWRVLLVLLITPAQSLAFVIALHCLPLQSPHLGWRANTTFWITLTLDIFVMNRSFVEQLKQVIPELPITWFQTIAVSILTTVVAVAMLVLASALWVFPVPFSAVWFSPFLVLTSFPFVQLVIGKEAWTRLPRLREKARVYGRILAVQGLLVIAYPAYNAVFVGLSPLQQAFFVVMPTVMKFGFKNLLCEACKSLPLGDELPELLIFTVDLFNAIYLTACMQSARSSLLVAFLVFLVGTAQLLQAVRQLLKRGKHVQLLQQQLRADSKRVKMVAMAGTSAVRQDPNAENLTAVGMRLCFQNGHRSSVTRGAIMGLDDIKQIFAQAGVYETDHGAGGRKGAVVIPARLLAVSPQVVSTQAQERLVQQILKTLFTIEYLILAEYVKCVIPIVSMVHTVVLYYLPAKKYYTSMEQFTDPTLLQEATQKVLLFLVLQLVTFTVLALLLQAKLRHSVFYHLSFVLEHNRHMIQMRLLSWVTFAFMLPMAHVGVDYSFEFKWMRHGFTDPYA